MSNNYYYIILALYSLKNRQTLAKKEKEVVKTPLMKQYYSIKAKHPDAVLLFRVGDFYETFSEDAIKAAGILGITLTKRANGAASFVELAGFPYHALDTYLPKLVRAGQRVAICEQLEDPKMTKTIVKRGVTELVTPGVSVNDNILNHKENNFLACVYIEKTIAGVAFLDISTGEFYTSEGSFSYVNKLLQNLRPKEILFERNKKEAYMEHFGQGFYNYPLDEWVFTEDAAKDRLLKHFETQSLKGFGVSRLEYGIIASGAILHYLDLTEHRQTGNITRISRIAEDEYVWLDRFTIKNLEIFSAMSEGGKALIDVMDHTISPMGSRMLKRWLALPLKNVKAINERLNSVDYFLANPEYKEEIELHLKQIGDLERLISKVALGRINPREVVALKNALASIKPIKDLGAKAKILALQNIAEQLNPCISIKEKIEKEINTDTTTQINKGGVMANGINSELDELRNIAYSGKDYLIQLQHRESERTGIPSLKIAFNNVFGYYIEVRNTHKDKVPEDWIRKQTLVNAERYITEELKDYEGKILGAEEKILALETKLFTDLVFSLTEFVPAIQLNAALISKLDCLLSAATLAQKSNYCKPNVNESNIIEVIEGRHPVIETQMSPGDEYVSNSVLLNQSDQQIIIITGPNMAGKSALLRQTALIVLMAQVGSFVPAQAVNLGYVDKIFTRVGASDNISMGESTFMVEMNEAASILNNVSDRSLILLDELGRGTSTYDGISIAWAIVEYIHENTQAQAKTLFATHYHELNEMEKSFKRVKNFNVSVKEIDKKIIFLRKLMQGGSEHSFGIHVAKMAGMPKSVINRAEKILLELEQTRRKQDLDEDVKELAKNREGMQLSFFQLDDPVLKQIRDEIKHLDINNLTPMEALNKLNEIKKLTGL
jgi:DNA mismatch repair protein MutS